MGPVLPKNMNSLRVCEKKTEAAWATKPKLINLHSFVVNPLVHSVHYNGRLTKIIILILEAILKNISYKRRDYESVDETILS